MVVLGWIVGIIIWIMMARFGWWITINAFEIPPDDEPYYGAMIVWLLFCPLCLFIVGFYALVGCLVDFKNFIREVKKSFRKMKIVRNERRLEELKREIEELKI